MPKNELEVDRGGWCVMRVQQLPSSSGDMAPNRYSLAASSSAGVARVANEGREGGRSKMAEAAGKYKKKKEKKGRRGRRASQGKREAITWPNGELRFL